MQFTVLASDKDQDNLTFSSVGLPQGATVTPTAIYGQEIFQWTPTAADVGTKPVTIAVSDSGNGDPQRVLSSQQQFNLVVRTSNAAPVLSAIANSSIDSGKTLTLQLAATDADGDQLTYSALNLPTGVILDPKQGILTWTPTASQEGTYTGIQLTASDGNQSSSQTFSVQVNHVNHSPVLTPLPVQTGKENSNIEFTIKANDVDRDGLIYSAVNPLPTGATFDEHIGLFSWKPNFEQAGEYDFKFAATDTSGAKDPSDVIVRVANVDRTPSIYISNHAVAPGQKLKFLVAGFDPDSNTTLTYTADSLPVGATLDSATGQFTWTPGAGQLGDYSVNFTVSDGELTASTQALLKVAIAQDVPLVKLNLTPSFPAVPGQKVIVQTQATGLADITNISATVDGQPVTIDRQGGFSFTALNPGQVEVVATASSADGRVGRTSTVIKVRDPQDTIAPVVGFAAGLDGDRLTNTTKIQGTVNDSNLDRWVLEEATKGSDRWTPIAQGSQSTDGVLAQFDPTTLNNGFYQLRLTATDIGGRSSSTQIMVEADTATKVGAYVRQETDLSINLGGTNLNLVRTYDSQEDNTSGIFGYGWRLANVDANIQTNVLPTGNEQFGVYNPLRLGTRLYLNLLTGSRVGFTFTPQKHTIAGLTYYTPA